MIRHPRSHREFEIWRSVAGPQPGLFIPNTISAETVHIGPWFHVYTKASELEPVADPVAAYEQLIRTAGCIDAVGTTALINNYLGSAPSTREAHEPLLAYLSPTRQERLAALDRDQPVDPPNTRVVFNRIACLVAIKLLLLRQDEWPSSVTLGVEGVGEFALLTNELLKEESPTSIVTDDWLLLEFLSNWDISNTSDVALSMSRTDRMIRDHLRGSDSRIAALRDKIGINVDTFDGCSLEEHQALTFSIYSVMSSAVAEMGAAVLLEPTVAESLTIPSERVTGFFDAHSHDCASFAADVRAASGSVTLAELAGHPEHLMDMRVFKARPFLRLDGERNLVLDLDCAVDLSASGMYWHLPASVSQEDRDDVPVLWGYVFEAYCRALLDHFYPSTCGFLHHEPTYRVGSELIPVEAVLNLGSVVLLFEFKSSKFKTEDIRSRERERVEGDLAKKFVGTKKRPKGIGQLARDAQEIARGALRHIGHLLPVHVYPVLVTEERLIESIGVNRHLNRAFRAALSADCAAMIRPLTVMSIEELEFVLPYVERGLTSWQYLLGSRFSGEDVRPFSVYQALWDIRRENSLPVLRNEYLITRWEEIFVRITPFVKDSPLASR